MHRLLVLVGAAGVAAAAATDGRLNVNFNACSSGGGGGASGCNVKHLVRYVEADFPPWDDVSGENDEHLSGFNVELFKMMCESAAFAGVQCSEVRDKWSWIWTHDDYPGQGLTAGWYDMGFAWVNTLRSHSFEYSYMMVHRVGNHFLAPVARSASSQFSATGAGETIILVCGYGDAPMVKNEYKDATFAPCVSDFKEQLLALDKAADPQRTLIWVGQAEWESMSAADKQKYKALNNGELLNLVAKAAHAGAQQDALAFMFARQNTCARDLVNRALAELRANGKYKTLCDKHPLANCYFENLTRDQQIAETNAKASSR